MVLLVAATEACAPPTLVTMLLLLLALVVVMAQPVLPDMGFRTAAVDGITPAEGSLRSKQVTKHQQQMIEQN